MRRFLLILLYIGVFSTVTFAQDVKVSATFDTSRIFLGDQVSFTITVEKPAGLSLILPVYKDTLLKNLEILKGPVSDTTFLNDGRLKIRSRYLVTSFDSGFYQIPPVYAEIKNEGGIKRFYSDYANLEVMRVKIAPADTTAKIFDIIKPYRAPLTIGEILPWLLVAFILAAVILAVIRIVKKLRRQKSGEVEVINPDPAHIIAFRELEKLKEEKLWEKGETKNYYSRLTEIIRQYLENRYGVYSLELTTAETLAALLKAGFKNDENFKKVKAILTGADLVKFAKHNPNGEENELNFQNSWDFVMATKVEENAVSAGAAPEKGKEAQS